jgi:hypothetical protein
MPGLVHFLRCVGRAAVRNGGKALASLLPFGEVTFEIARDALAEYCQHHSAADLRAELHGLAQAPHDEVRLAVEEIVAHEAAGRPAELRLALLSYLDQVPPAIRESLAQPAVSAAVSLGRPEDLLPFLPAATEPSVSVTSPKRTYTLRGLLAVGDAADVHLAAAGESLYTLKASRIPEGRLLLEREHKVLASLLTTAGDTTYHKYLPTLAESFPVSDRFAKRINVFLHEPGFFSLEQVHEQHPALDGRHLAWVFKRLLTVLGFCHGRGTLHGAVLPCHVMLHAANHGLQLVGWGQSAPAGQPLAAVSTRYRDWYPPEVWKKQPATPATDLFLAARCLVYLAGGDPVADRMPDAVPVLMQRFVRTCLLHGVRMRPDDAWKLHDEFDELLRGLYGPPKFHSLIMT